MWAQVAYPELPPRVEYRFMPFGGKFLGVLEGIVTLQREIEP